MARDLVPLAGDAGARSVRLGVLPSPRRDLACVASVKSRRYRAPLPAPPEAPPAPPPEAAPCPGPPDPAPPAPPLLPDPLVPTWPPLRWLRCTAPPCPERPLRSTPICPSPPPLRPRTVMLSRERMVVLLRTRV